MMLDSTQFWDRIAQGYSKKPIADPINYARKLSSTQARMRPEMRVLEFGCGTGSTALEHAPHVARIVATDLSAAMVAIAREKANNVGVENVVFQRCGIDEYEAPDESFDMVLVLSLLHLLADRANALARIHRLLKPEGIFVSSTPCLADKMGILRPLVAVMRWMGKAPDVRFLRAGRLSAEIAAVGFEEEEAWCHSRSNNLFLLARKV